MLSPVDTDEPTGARLPDSWIASLFRRMSGMYGARFSDMWKGVDPDSVRNAWAEGLAHLTADELRTGVSALSARAFPPTLPEFVALCRPPLNYDAALQEAVQQLHLRADGKDQWSNPALYWAALKVGEFDMLHLSRGALLDRFSAALDDVMRNAVHPVPPSTVALPAPGRARAKPEAVRGALETVRATQRVPGGKQWASAILERAKRGESVPLACYQAAQRALGVTGQVAA